MTLSATFQDAEATPSLSIVVPCYNEEEAISAFFASMQKELEKLNMSWEIICVNDGSRDHTLDALIAYAKKEHRIKIINLTRNFGKEAALTAGLEYASGRAIIPIDVDLQDPPELIASMLEKWREGFDVVYARRVSRQSDSTTKRLTAKAFYHFYNYLTTVPIPANSGDFRLMDRRVVDALKHLPERNRFMKGIFAWLGFRSTSIDFERQPRNLGQTKWNYWKLWNFALDGLTSFSTVPLRIWTYIGLFVATSAFCYAAYLVIRTLVSGTDVQGYASLMVAILFLGGVQLISLGIIGEYLGRTFTEVKHRPIYLVDNVYQFGDASRHSS